MSVLKNYHYVNYALCCDITIAELKKVVRSKAYHVEIVKSDRNRSIREQDVSSDLPFELERMFDLKMNLHFMSATTKIIHPLDYMERYERLVSENALEFTNCELADYELKYQRCKDAIKYLESGKTVPFLITPKELSDELGFNIQSEHNELNKEQAMVAAVIQADDKLEAARIVESVFNAKKEFTDSHAVELDGLSKPRWVITGYEYRDRKYFYNVELYEKE